MLGRQVLTDEENNNIPLCYHVVDNFQIQFGKEEFCLVTGLKFGVENMTDYNDEAKAIPFRRRVFSSSLDGRPIRGKYVEELIKSDHQYQVYDERYNREVDFQTGTCQFRKWQLSGLPCGLIAVTREYDMLGLDASNLVWFGLVKLGGTWL
nr:transposase, MuDR, MULE transposase domain protein [Tanacetum cinerariifolium]